MLTMLLIGVVFAVLFSGTFGLADLIMGGTPDYAGAAQVAEQNRQAAITQGTTNINRAFAGFTPQFYNQRAQAYLDFTMPQLAQQYQDARSQIGFGLANRNLMGSSAAGQRYSDLSRQFGQAQQGLSDTATSLSQQLQEQVASSKQNLLNQLYQSADPAGASASAIQSAASLRAPSVIGPLANQFSNLIQQYYLNSILNPQAAAAYPVTQQGYGGGFAPLPQNY